MKVLLKAATIIDADSPYNNQTVDVLIDNGIISKIDHTISTNTDTEELALENLHISQGWFDSSVCIGEPGFEERETITNALDVAAQNGFTAIAVHPNSNPVIDNTATLSFLKAKSFGKATNLHPIGSLTTGSKGIDLAELYDMQEHGAIAFGDYKKPINNPNLLKLALLYTQNFNGLVQSYPQDNQIAGKGMVHEGEQSTLLGLKAIPALAEELQIARDLFVLEYTGGKLHIPTISTEKSVSLIREAKRKGLQVTCSVTTHHLTLTDEVLSDYDSNYKVQPPLRTKKDVIALIRGVEDHTIDMITSDHRPMDTENKKVEFDNASYGTIGLESSFGACNTVLPTSTVINSFTRGKSIFGIPTFPINVGNKAEVTLFSPTGDTVFTTNHIQSSSDNSAFINRTLRGTVYGIYANQQLKLK